ncbi:hypothetical protein PSQ40_03990 [Curvibacter sp. HBC61]|uniref:Energy-coupling factor ABC transporter permease n=1 Tax=Curvibacter cyanobacteriorum TaxID=3026422 RepID=A0ABT5MY59_9BURK|nr:hypothetical protein [Curvibacter sp. HBC61]MDD0837727.1 hypothetical protein [Curvibacter sp. HBC61]
MDTPSDATALLQALAWGLALLVSALMRPWRLLSGPQGSQRLSTLLGFSVLLPWLWALPWLHAMPLQLQWSGACLAVLMLGWPLAAPCLLGVALSAGWLAGQGVAVMLDQAFWQGLLPATLALLLGAAIRRWIGPHLFVYVLGRAFLGTVACNFAATALAQWTGHALPGVDPGLSLVAHWLMAWGDGFMTGMLAAILVAFRPQWLATWSDSLYLPKP